MNGLGTRPRNGDNLRFAPHVGQEMDGTVAAFKNALSEHSVQYLAHYAFLMWDFSVDALSDAVGDQRRKQLQRAGLQYSRECMTIDEDMLGLSTGRLIRSVLQGEKGALFCDAVVPGRYAVGFCEPMQHPSLPSSTAPSKVVEADKTVSALAEALREQIRLGSQNHGGWRTENTERQATSESPARGDFGCRWTGDPSDATRSRWESVLDERSVHFLAYSVDGDVHYSADCFDTPALDPFFVTISRDERRRSYQKWAADAVVLGSVLGRIAAGVIGRTTDRIVLDVEQGAFYYYRLDVGRWLMGLTLRQDRVAHADQAVAELARTWEP